MTVQTMVGEFSLTVFRDTIKKGLHLAFWRGDINPQKPFLTRVMVHPTLLDGMLKELPGALMERAFGVGAYHRRRRWRRFDIVISGGGKRRYRRSVGNVKR